MEDVGKPSGLVKRKGSAVWYFRQRCPLRLRAVGVPDQIWISLETASYPLALTRLEEARQEALRRFTVPRPATGIYSRSLLPSWSPDESLPLLTSEMAASLARSFFTDVVRGLDSEPPHPAGFDDTDKHNWRRELETMLARLTGADADDGIDDVAGARYAVLRKVRLRTEPGSGPCNLLHNYLRRAMAQSCRIRLARLDGDYADPITDRLFINASPAQDVVGKPDVERETARQGTTSLDPDIVDRWSTERKVSAKGVDKHRAVARWFHQYVGVIPVEAITKRDVLAFKNKMVAQGVTAANANAKLSCLRTLLGYAVENDHLEANPADGISVHDKDKDRRKRKEFDLPALHALFASPVYVANERSIRGRGEAAYWLPLVALYTGARLEEIAQLRVTDVRQEAYLDGDDREQSAWVICVMQEDGLSTKNANSERRIPVHPDLLDLGLVKHVEQAISAGHERIFPALTPNKYGRLGAKWGEWWSIYRREVCDIADRRMVFHSFRHTFKYHARHVGMIEGVQRQIMGHSPGDTADEYGPSGYSLYQIVEGMKLYRIPGLVLPPPPPLWR